MGGLLAAVGFLTVVPLPAATTRPGETLAARAVAWFPLVGLAQGALLAATAWGCARLLPGPTSAAVVVAAWAVLSGALHLDGVADTADAAFAPVPRARRLEILRDVHHGTFGVVAVALVLLLKWSAIAPLAGRDGAAAVAIAVIVSRCTIMPALAFAPPARPDGMAAAMRDGATATTVVAGLAAGVAAALFCFGLPGAALAGGGLALTLAATGWLTSRFGGLTGDLCGALIETTEAATLLAACALLSNGWMESFPWGMP